MPVLGEVSALIQVGESAAELLSGSSETSLWQLPAVYHSLRNSQESFAVFMRLRLAVDKSGVEFESTEEKMIVNRLKSSRPKDFASKNMKRRGPCSKKILSFSYFGGGFSLEQSLKDICKSLVGHHMQMPMSTYLEACYICFGAFTFNFPLRASTIAAIRTDVIDRIEFDDHNGVCYIEIESHKTSSTTVRAYPHWLGSLLKVIRDGRPWTDSDLLFIRPDGIPFKKKILRNYIMRKWSAGTRDEYIGGNMGLP